jgi:uncharacterized protein (TIGR02413 family)
MHIRPDRTGLFKLLLTEKHTSMPQGELCPAAFLCLFAPRGGFLAAFCGGVGAVWQIVYEKYALKGGGKQMILNILFFTITINKRKRSLEEIRHNEMVGKMLEEHKNRQAMIRPF